MSATSKEAYALRVFLRVRPFLSREAHEESAIIIDPPSGSGMQTVSVKGEGEDRRGRHGQMAFTFDGVFGPGCSQTDVFTRAVSPQVNACLQGFNSTVFCYGPSGTGKSFTCYGPETAGKSGSATAAAQWAASADAGMIPRAAEQLFATIERGSGALKSGRFLLRVSFLQLYRESLSDLLAHHSSSSNHTSHAAGGGGGGGGSSAHTAAGASLALREDPQSGFFVENLTEVTVRSAQEVCAQAATGPPDLLASGRTNLRAN